MRKIISILCILILFMSLNVSSAFAFIISGIFNVYAEYNSAFNNPCTSVSYSSIPLDTGIDIVVGDCINITASGQWKWSGREQDVCGPDGVGYPDWLPDGALLGKISDVQLPFFEEDPWSSPDKYLFIGSNLQNFVAPVSGHFFMVFKDSNFGDNSGYVTANVIVNRPEIVSEPATLLFLSFGLLGAGLFKKRSFSWGQFFMGSDLNFRSYLPL